MGIPMNFWIRKKSKDKKRLTPIQELINNPEKFKLEAFIENEDVIVKISKRDES